MTDFFLFSSIRDYLYARIAYFTEHVLSQNLTLALTVILGLLTVWVMIQGYLIAVGKSHEGLKGFILNMFKTYFVVAIALGTASGGSFGVRFMTETLTDGISQIMTGNSDVGTKCLMQETQTIVGCKIDQNLAATQAMMATLSGIDTADDDYLEGKLTEARWFAGVGTAGPAIVAGGMLMVFRVGMSLFIGFAPIFILCLLFKKNRAAVPKMAVLRACHHLFGRPSRRDGGYFDGFGRQYRRYFGDCRYHLDGADRAGSGRDYAERNPAIGFGIISVGYVNHHSADGGVVF